MRILSLTLLTLAFTVLTGCRSRYEASPTVDPLTRCYQSCQQYYSVTPSELVACQKDCENHLKVSKHHAEGNVTMDPDTAEFGTIHGKDDNVR